LWENPHQITGLVIARNYNYTGHYSTYIPTCITYMGMHAHSIDSSVCFTKYGHEPSNSAIKYDYIRNHYELKNN